MNIQCSIMKFKTILTFYYCFIYLATGSYANFLNELRGKNCHSSDGVEIYSKWNDGCLDGGLYIGYGNYLVYPNPVCPKETHSKWRFELNAILVSRRSNGAMCLDCTLGKVDCVLVGHGCHGNINQNFLMSIYSNQIDYKNGRYYFSINSQKYPSRCLTVFEGYHKVHQDWFNSAIFKQHNYLQDGAYQAWHSSFRLEECTGSTNQSFYFKKNWYEEIEDFLNEVNNK